MRRLRAHAFGVECFARADHVHAVGGQFFHAVEFGRRECAFPPVQADGFAVTTLSEMVDNVRTPGRVMIAHAVIHLCDFNARGIAQVERPERCVECVATDVAETAAAVVPPAAPFLGEVIGRVVARSDGALPNIPVEVFGDGGGLATFAGRPAKPDGVGHGAIGPAVDILDVADHALLDPFDDESGGFPGVALVAHDGLDAVFSGGFFDGARLPNVMREWLLNEDVFARLHRGHADGEVAVIRRGDKDRVDLVAYFVEHDAEIGEAFGVGMRGGKIKRAALAAELLLRAPVDIAEGDGVFRTRQLHGVGPHVAAADDGDVDFVFVGIRSCFFLFRFLRERNGGEAYPGNRGSDDAGGGDGFHSGAAGGEGHGLFLRVSGTVYRR